MLLNDSYISKANTTKLKGSVYSIERWKIIYKCGNWKNCKVIQKDINDALTAAGGVVKHFKTSACGSCGAVAVQHHVPNRSVTYMSVYTLSGTVDLHCSICTFKQAALRLLFSCHLHLSRDQSVTFRDLWVVSLFVRG